MIDPGQFTDEHGPNLDLLVRVCGGYDKITPEVWTIYDTEIAAWRSRQEIKHSATVDWDAVKLAMQTRADESHHCFVLGCRANASFGYRQGDGSLAWFCSGHRQAEWWADARR